MNNTKKIISIIILVLFGVAFFKLDLFTAPKEKATATETDTEETKTMLQESPAPLRYENKKYNFSFDKPEGYTVGILRDDVGETVLVQNSKISSGFQIYITPTDGNITLNKQQIEADLPETSVINPQTINLDGKADGIMFENSSSAPGTFEIWFAYQDFLYQVSSYKNFVPELLEIINTWRFSD